MRFAAIAGFVLAAILQAQCRGADAHDPETHVLTQGEFVVSDTRSPPSDDAPWRPVTLPDNWFLSHPGPARAGWYRLPFDLAPESAGSTHTL